LEVFEANDSIDSRNKEFRMTHAKRLFRLPLLVLLTLLVIGTQVEATTYAVKAGGGGNFTTIQACANAAVAGDTCTVFAGTYGGWTQSTSGSAGNPITFIASAGDTVTVTGGIIISSRSYIRISGFHFSLSGGSVITGNGSSSHNQVDHNTATTTIFRINDSQGSNGSDNYLGYNTVDLTGHTDNAEGFYVYGDRNLFEYNEIKNGQGDCHDLGGTNVVVRHEYCHDMNGASGEHIDFIQEMGGGVSPPLSFSLIENNVEQHCFNDGGNCHFVIIRTGSGPVADTIIVRYNFEQNLDGGGLDFGGVGDNVPNAWAYNNTFAPESLYNGNGGAVVWQNGLHGAAFNNIVYNATLGSTKWSPFYSTTGDSIEGGNISFTSGYSGDWGAPYTSESTYAALHSKDPLFANYPTDDTLQAGSPAISAGVALTSASAAGSNSTTLAVANAHGFQAGWAGTNADWIRIGTTTTVQISSINYSSNVITLAKAVSWNKGDGIYLYSDSNGDNVLKGGNPSVGASNGPPPPENLQGNVH
jgi:hypothetical protein